MVYGGRSALNPYSSTITLLLSRKKIRSNLVHNIRSWILNKTRTSSYPRSRLRLFYYALKRGGYANVVSERHSR
ncbi:hypothetical protein K443DRAFT_381242 [Laccaria amethystina LaAM-08-1]|uniref:Uncharacterized protein n=1 Tax=Laccaria amethystina LaAM-08-1 TaxID=1095629 RepID=A0A0C9XBV0_9AGAR|nr:hypothetical protein K443DRAFT_381242 [Laccaria amethystina LaAM-08-1]